MTPDSALAWLAETSLAVSLLIILVLIVRKPAARRFGADAAYLLWFAPALRLLLPELPSLPSPVAGVGAAPGAILSFETSLTPTFAQGGPDLAVAVLALWAAGAVAFLFVQTLQHFAFRREALSGGADASPALRAEAAAIAARMGLAQPIALRRAPDNRGPFVTGVLAPTIVLPADFETRFTAVERELALTHEFSHLRRGDLVASLAALVFRAAQWPNPLAHAAFAAFRTDQEAACDAAVLVRCRALPGAAHAYGEALLKAAAAPRATPATCLSMSHHLKERLMTLKNAARPGASARLVAATMIAASVAMTASYSTAHEGKSHKEHVEKRVIAVAGDETIVLNGVAGAKRVEIETDGKGGAMLRAYDSDGKLLLERKEAAGAIPALTIRSADGKERAIDLAAAGGHDRLMKLDGDGGLSERRIEIIRHPDNAGHAIDGAECAGAGKEGHMIVIGDDDERDGEKIVEKMVLCLDGADAADPAKRAEALKKAIARIEEHAAKRAEHQAKALALLKAELAKAETEAKKK